jgi:hypothetical protein
MEEKNKKRWPRVRPYSFLFGVSSLPCSAETQWALSFWPLRPLVRRVVAMLRPMCFCTVEDGRLMCLNLQELGGIVPVTSVVLDAWMSSWWNNRSHDKS